MTENNSYPLVSIIMLPYNHERYIQESLEALFKQDYPNFEVIIRDDGSTDNTPVIIRDFVSKIKNIHIIVEYGKNVGLIKSYNWVLSRASGDIVMGCGTDDVYLPGRISYAVEMHKRFKEIDLFVCNGQVISDDGKLIRESFFLNNETTDYSGIRKYENLDYELAMNYSVAGFGMSYNKKILKPFGYQFPENLLFEDAFMGFLAAVQNGAVISMKPLVKYRRAINSLSRVDPDLDRTEMLKRENKFLKMFLSLEHAKLDYLQRNLPVNSIIQKNKSNAVSYLEQKIEIIKIEINITEERFVWKNWFRLLFLLIKGDKSKYALKVLILSFFRKKFEDKVIKYYKNRAAVL